MRNIEIMLMTFIIISVILYTIDKKPFSIMIDFISIVLTIGVLIMINKEIDYTIISYILIIIYGSAIIIIFGFIVMIYNYRGSKEYNKINIFLEYIRTNKITPMTTIIPQIRSNKFIKFIIIMIIIGAIVGTMGQEIGDIRWNETHNQGENKIIEEIFQILYNSKESKIYIGIIINILIMTMIGIISILI